MKTTHLIPFILIGIISTTLSWSDEPKANFTPPKTSSGTSTSKSAADMFLGWTDIPKSIIEVTKETKNPLWGLTGGTLKGIGKAFPKTVSGTANVVAPHKDAVK